MFSAIGFFFRKNVTWLLVIAFALLLGTAGAAFGGWQRAKRLLKDTQVRLAGETAAREAAQRAAVRKRKEEDDLRAVTENAAVKRKVVLDALEVIKDRKEAASEAMHADIAASGTASDEVNRRIAAREAARKGQP